MNELDRGSVIFKHQAEDFIVEEIGEEDKYTCSVSESVNDLAWKHVDLYGVDLNDRRDFLTCDLEKVNIDHFSVIAVLCKELGNLMHEIGYAGTKDKVAWTCQRISIFNAHPDKIKVFSHPGILLKNFKWAKHKLKIGDLKGNRFKITLRDVDKQALKVLTRVRNSDYAPNYFGAQRFGSVRNENVGIGTLILKRKYQEAVFTYLISYGENESYEVQKAKRKLKSEKDISKAHTYFPQELRNEHRMLSYIAEHPEDYLGALMTLGEKQVLLMCQSVQSHLFNEILERAVNEGVDLKNKELPLLGYNSAFSPSILGQIERKVLADAGLNLQDFNFADLPSLILSHGKRKALFKVQDLTAETAEDELFEGSKKITLSFILTSGTYATTFLEQFFTFR